MINSIHCRSIALSAVATLVVGAALLTLSPCALAKPEIAKKDSEAKQDKDTKQDTDAKKSKGAKKSKRAKKSKADKKDKDDKKTDKKADKADDKQAKDYEAKTRKLISDLRSRGKQSLLRAQLTDLAQYLFDHGRAIEAEPLYEEAVKLAEADSFGDKAALALLLNDAGANYWETGKYSDAEACYKKAIPFYEELLKDASPAKELQSGYVCVLTNLGNTYETLGDYDQAVASYQKALDYGKANLGPADSNTIDALEGIGVVYEDQEKAAKAEPFLLEAVKLREASVGQSKLDGTLISLACVNLDLRDYQAAHQHLERALKIQEKLHGKEHPAIADTLIQLATLAQNREQYDLAKQQLQRCISIREKLLGKSHFHTALALNNLAYVHQLETDYPSALALYKRAVAICEKAFGDDAKNLNVANVYSCYASLLYRMNRVEDAEGMKSRSQQIRDRMTAGTD